MAWSGARRRHGCSAAKMCGTKRRLTETRSTTRSGRGGGAAAGERRRSEKKGSRREPAAEAANGTSHSPL